ncbi:DUF6768 family protein [Paraglaciecola aquimarina]|uniref:DUF6768 family protein n=1 Tax=Paraglaciecola aquimarina TaxID=1235557 RepID=A0ABU3SYT3_9ALTE|nr:DUF6768 family protein [Paraglaciecola aquimarina]MDU0355077.1 DUF6768 family protein [Paraglaciecola aquimarina]
MNIDEKIKRELEQQSTEIDKILAEEQGIGDFVLGSIRNSLKGWFILINLIVIVVTAVMFWTGYQFVQAQVVEQQIFWAVWFLASLIVQVALKQWIWAEMSRSSLIREIKRVELTMERSVKSLTN